MSDNIKRSIVIGAFVFFNLILPTFLFKIGAESDWLFVVFKLLSVIAIPIFMFNSYNMSKIVNYLAVTFLLIELVYLETGLSATHEISEWFNSMVVLLNYPMVFFFGFVAWTLKTVFFFENKSIAPLVVLMFLFFIRRFIEFTCVISKVGYDIGYYTRIGASPEYMNLIMYRGIMFFIYALVMYIFLEMLLYEDRKIRV